MRRCVYNVDINFFKNWNSKMAYILGITFSDGNIYKNVLSWQLQMRDKEILYKIRDAMKSDYPIDFSTKKNAARLRISNPLLVESLRRFGFTSYKIKFPDVPAEFLRDFMRGFLDGDGWIIANKNKMEISVGFSNGSQEFLEELVRGLNMHVSLTNNHLRVREKVTKRGKLSVNYKIEWYGMNALNILKFLYDDLKNDDLYLERKYRRQLETRDLYTEIRKGRKWREIEHKYKVSMEKLLSKLFAEWKLNGVQIAKVLGVSSAAVYRWLEKTKIRTPIRREIVFIKCPICGIQFRQRNGPRKYCSLVCAGQANRSGKMVECAVCGRKTYRPSWWFKRNAHPLCSKECCRKWRRMRLENNFVRRCKKSGRFLSSASDSSMQSEVFYAHQKFR